MAIISSFFNPNAASIADSKAVSASIAASTADSKAVIVNSKADSAIGSEPNGNEFVITDMVLANTTADVIIKYDDVPVYDLGLGGNNVYDIQVSSVWYRVHEFTTVGTTEFVPPSNTNFEVLVVAGGGAGGTRTNGPAGGDCSGGGGAGGLKRNLAFVNSLGSYSVTVGAGGINSTGGNSIFDTLIAHGGGYNGGSGGSGSGGRHSYDAPSGGAGGTGISGEGYNGGNGASSWEMTNGGSGGGGGSAGIGSDPVGTVYVTPGGPGTSISITGTPIIYAKGGDGQHYELGSGANGTINTGNGGSSGSVGGNGGSGIVIIRYPKL